MTCEQFQELILTDYLDKQMGKTQRKLVDDHLLHCAECCEFARLAGKSVIEPFARSEKIVPSEEVWFKIKDALVGEAEQPRPDFLDDLRERIHVFFSHPVLVSGMAALLVLLTIGTTAQFRSIMEAKKVRSHEQIEYLAYLTQPAAEAGDSEDSGYGTEIEEYFL